MNHDGTIVYALLLVLLVAVLSPLATLGVLEHLGLIAWL